MTPGAAALLFLAALGGCALPSGNPPPDNAPPPVQTTWQEEFAKMPLTKRAPELNRSNCVALLLGSFRRNPAVKGLIFMPGATDEFYFFRRARATLTNSRPTLLDAVAALTNQTWIRATLRPPFLLLHTAEDSLEPIGVVEDQKAADSVRQRPFAKAALFNDLPWDGIQPLLGRCLDARMEPPPSTHASNHFFRHSFAAFDLNGWEALKAVSLAGKTTFTVKKNMILFEGDTRVLGAAPTEGFSPH
jgi:hypothetical protein